MKLNGIFGTGSGKTGNAVFATSAGKQIVRSYQPKVSNPNTKNQIAQRAKFKLLSQLAAAMAPVIAIPKDGLTSSRNRFVSVNAGLANFSDGVASIGLENVQLTISNTYIPAFTATRGQNNKVNVSLENKADASINGIMYAVFEKNINDQLTLVDYKICETRGTAGTFAEELNGTANELVVYAYGVKENVAGSLAHYNNYETPSDSVNASLQTNKSLLSGAFAFTKTNAVTVAVS